MLAPVASIHVLNTASIGEDVDGRDKPDHDGRVISSAFNVGPLLISKQKKPRPKPGRKVFCPW
jgi:hypothetical protein